MKSYKSDGFFLAKNFVCQEELKKIRRQFGQIFGDKNDADKACVETFKNDLSFYLGCANACNNMLSVINLFVNDKMNRCLKNMGMKMPSLSTRPIVHFSSPKTAAKELYWRVPSHQDWPSNQGSFNGITCWIPLQKTNKELGALEVVPGSHLLGPLQHHYEDIPILEENIHGFVSVEMELGDALFFSTFLVHRSGQNLTDKVRFSIATRYNDVMEEEYRKRKYPRAPTGEGRINNSKLPVGTIEKIFNVDKPT